MTDDTTAQNWVEIPGVPTIRHSVVPNIRVELPLRIHVRGGMNLFMQVISVLLGIIFVISSKFLIDILLYRNEEIFLKLKISIFLLISIYSATILIGCGLAQIKDYLRRKPCLIISEAGFIDSRSGVAMNWSDISSGSIRYSAHSVVMAVDLRLRRPVKIFQNPFRVGALGINFRQRPGHYWLSVGCMDKSRHVLAYTILALIKRHGGEGIIKEGAFDLPLDITGPARL